MKSIASFILAAAAVTVAVPASAQFAKPEDAIKYRQSALTVMGAHFGRVAGMANGRIPFDAKVAADNAAIAETMSKLPWLDLEKEPTRVPRPGPSLKSGPTTPSSRKPARRCRVKWSSLSRPPKPAIWTPSRRLWVPPAAHAKAATTTSARNNYASRKAWLKAQLLLYK